MIFRQTHNVAEQYCLPTFYVHMTPQQKANPCEHIVLAQVRFSHLRQLKQFMVTILGFTHTWYTCGYLLRHQSP